MHRNRRLANASDIEAQRLRAFGKNAKTMKSKKYPLFSLDEGVMDAVAEAIYENHLALYGPLNIDEQFRVDSGEEIYYLIRLWHRALQLGGVFAVDKSELQRNLSDLNKNQMTVYAKTLQQSPLLSRLNIEKTEVFLSKEIRLMKGGKVENKVDEIEKATKGCFSEKVSKEEDVAIKALANKLVGASQAEQLRFKAEFFGIQLSQESVNKVKEGFTFCLVPELYCEDEMDIVSFIVHQLTLLKRLSSTGHARECLPFLGIGITPKDKGKAYSNFLGKDFLGVLQSENFDSIYDFMYESYGGWKGKEDLLKARIQTLAKEAKNLPGAKYANQHKNSVGHFHGKLQSWASNFFRCFVEVEEQLDVCKSDFAKALALIDHVKGKSSTSEKVAESLDHYRGLILLLEELSEAILDPDTELIESFSLVRKYTLIHGSIGIFLSALIGHADEEFLISIYPREKKKKHDDGNGNESGEENGNGGDDEYEPLKKPESGWLFSYRNLFRELCEDIKRIQRFFGEAFLENCEKLKNAAVYFDAIFGQWNMIVEALLSSPAASHVFNEEFLLRRLQLVLNVFRHLQSRRFGKLLRDACLPYADIFRLSPDDVFWKGPYDNRKYLTMIQSQGVPTGTQEACMQLVNNLLHIGFDWKKFQGYDREDFLSIHALIAAILGWTHSGYIDMSQYDWKQNPTFVRYMDARKACELSLSVSGAELSEFFESCLFAELFDLDLLLRRKSFKSSATVQTAGVLPNLVYQPISKDDPKRKRPDSTDQPEKTPLITPPKKVSDKFLSLSPEDFLKKVVEKSLDNETRLEMLHYLHWWGVELPCNFSLPPYENPKNLLLITKPEKSKETPKVDEEEVREDGQELSEEGGVGEESAVQSVSENKPSFAVKKWKGKNPVVWIKTSHRELRYLEYFLYPPEEKGIRVNLSEPSLYAERQIEVTWDFETLSCSFQPGKPKVYISYPFKLQPDQSMLLGWVFKDRYMGLDPGVRAGVAYAITKVVAKPFSYHVDERGFFEDSRLQDLERYSLGPKQPLLQPLAKGTSRKTQRVRKSLQHGLWNKYHKKMIDCGAMAVHEESVGTQGPRGHWLRSFYENIKKLDFWSDDDATKKLQAGRWGGNLSDKKKLAIQIKADGTSQFCLACHRWYQLFLSAKDTVRVVAQEGPFVTFEIQSCGERVYGYHEHRLAIGSKIEIDQFRKMVWKFMCPPLFDRQGDPCAVFQKFVMGKQHPRYKFDPEFVGRFGNSALFVCPRPSCLHFDHKDEQSAVTISLLGYLADQENIAGKKVPYVRLAELLDEFSSRKK